MDNMMDRMGGMGLMMLVGLLVVAIVIGVAIYLAIRAAHAGRPREPEAREPEARELLQRRLASGEITPEEFYERESALRDAQPAGRRR